MKPQDIVFVHGVQWERDIQLQGYSLPLQQRIQSLAPTTTFNFHEALWSDVVEPHQRQLIAGGKTLTQLAAGQNLEALLDFLTLVGNFTGVNILGDSNTMASKKLEEMIDDPGFLGKAISVTLDVLMYLTPYYGNAIRERVRQYINSAENPVLMGHSLGTVILFDILKEDAMQSKLTCRDFLTAASPLGLFRPDADINGLASINWVNMYDPADLVGFWNPLKKWGYTNPYETRIKTSEYPFYSHVKYWTSSTIADELLDMACS